MTSDKLMLFDGKTEFIAVASRHLLKKAAANTIRVGDCDVSKISVLCRIWVRGSMIHLLWSYTLPKYAVLLSITCTTLDA